MDERRALVQGELLRDVSGRPLRDAARNLVRKPDGTIAWSEHEEAWRAYDAKWRCGQSAERIHQRGGFGWSELCEFLGREPLTWEVRAARAGREE
jgi:hypothetical protein